MSYILNYSKWRKIFEAEDPNAAISNVKSRMGFVGATPSKTSNASALAEFKTAFTDATVTGEIDETKALFRKETAKSSKLWETRAKTQTAKNYLKIGDIILNGDSGKPVTITVESADLISKSVEASGNGIFALGRALAMRKGQKLLEGKIIIGLNTKSANSFLANADTAFQTPVGDFENSIMFTFVVSKAVIPGAGNAATNVITAKDAAAKGTVDPNIYTNNGAMPQLPKDYWESLKKVSPIDTTAFVAKIKGKAIKSYSTELVGYVNEYINTFYEPFLTAYAERFKSFLKSKATEAGIDSALFQDLFAYIDEWKKTQSKKTYTDAALGEIRQLFSNVTVTGSTSQPAASAAGTVVKGTEGKIGQ
jgi:hypothetical protein